VPTELHLALQRHYAGDDGAIEAPLDGYRADVLRGGVVYEIQTGSFANIRRKVETLGRSYPVVVVYPVPQRKIIVNLDPETGAELSSRRSPKRGRPLDIFYDLLPLREALQMPLVSVEIVLTVERELRQADGRGSWRRKGVSTVGRELVEVAEQVRYTEPRELLQLLPADLPEPFSVADLQAALGCRKIVAGRMAYALRHLGATTFVGKRGNAYLYERAGPPPAAPRRRTRRPKR
jgi:hypothetical protein